NILRDLADPKVHGISYSGHSQIGGTILQAPAQSKLKAPSTRKFFLALPCVGTQGIPALSALSPHLAFITRHQPLVVAEVPGLLSQFYQGIEKGENYYQIHNRLETLDGVLKYARGRLVTPNQTAKLANVDFDHNGVLDVDQAPGAVDVQPPKQSKVAVAL